MHNPDVSQIIEVGEPDYGEITDYIFLQDQEPSADVAIVFGTIKAWQDSVTTAAELYHTGQIPRIIVTGGPNKHTGIVEGQFMYERLLEFGVSPENILVERSATNTLENVIFSALLMAQNPDWRKIRSVTAVVKNYHARRAFMTLHNHLPVDLELKVAPYTSTQFPFTRDDWMHSEQGRSLVFGELDKIQKYLALGHIKEL